MGPEYLCCFVQAVIAKFGAKSLDFSGELVVRLLPLLDEVRQLHPSWVWGEGLGVSKSVTW